MHFRQLAAAGAVTAVTAALGVTGAPGASAETFNVDACQSGSYTVLDGDVVNFYWIDGENGVCQGLVAENVVGAEDFSVSPHYCNRIFFGSDTFVTGDNGFRISVGAVATLGNAIAAYACGVLPPPPPIPEWVQAYGRASADATCEDGWGPSWQEWAQQVTGGWVCTRSIPSLGQ